MKIIVCVKHVPDTETRIRIADDGKSINKEGVSFVMNPYDEYAVEEAVSLIEDLGEGEVIAVTLGPEDAQETLRKALAMGAEKAVHLKDEKFENLDSLGTAKALKSVCEDIDYDLIFTGQQGIGGDNSQVGPMIAEMLDLPHINVVTEFEYSEGTVTCSREVEGAEEIIECDLPVLVTAQKGLNEPRYPALKGIMAAKKKEIREETAESLGLDENDLALKVETQKMELPPEKGPGRILEGEPDEMARELVKILHEEEKII